MDRIYENDKAIPVTWLEIKEKGEGLEFKAGDLVKVTGISKGKGFQGVVKRHGFHGGPKSHGQKERHRAPGSIGSTAPQRVLPGRRMAGRMGGDQVSVKNLKLIAVYEEKNQMALRGAIPGRTGGLLKVYPINKIK